MIPAAILTILQTTWAIWWLRLHLRIRSGRNYAAGRHAVSSNFLYQTISPLLYVLQNGLCIASFWSNDAWLLKIHDSNAWRIVGFILFFLGSILYAWALRHLGTNYSPCYDSHLPTEIVKTGPYHWIRHPMYGAKFLIGAATIVVSGSLWFVPTTIYFYWTTNKTLVREDNQLRQLVPGYQKYQTDTTMLIPRVI